MAKDINSDNFDEATKLKLAIFKECFKEWLPVFIHHPHIQKLYIFDFFAGSGKDKIGNAGSPLILINEARGTDQQYCNEVRKEITFHFNEIIKEKASELCENTSDHLRLCKGINQCRCCVYNLNISSQKFRDVFNDKNTQEILNNEKFGKFILLDQYGFKEIDDDTFKQLISFPFTDFIFFISSSFIKRFKEHPYTKAYIDTSKLNFDESLPKECHRIIANYYRQLIPLGKKYYLHNFSIQKDPKKGNYYGLIFGTNHSLGMEKFLKVCWGIDVYSGEANFNINNDFGADSLFYNPETSNKKVEKAEEIKKLILTRKITSNLSGFEFTLQQGCLPKLFSEVVKELENSGKIIRKGNLNYRSTNIHKVPEYIIEVL